MEIEKLNLTNPDQEEESNYGWPDEFLQSILGAMLSDSYFLLQSVNLIKPNYFRHEAHRLICKVILTHQSKYNEAPSKVIVEAEISEQIKEPGLRDLYLSELDVCCDVFIPGAEKREYFLDKIANFAKTQALRVAYSQTIDIFRSRQNDKWSQIREILQNALLVERNVDLGLEYLSDIEERYKIMMSQKDNQDFFPTGFPSIDAALTLGSIAGSSGAGKSLVLVKIAKENLYRGRNVLIISLELSENLVAERLDSMLTGVPIRSLYYGNSPELVKEALNEGSKHWGKLVIKQFPAGTADVNTCRAFINQLHLHGFYPAQIFVDYVGEMNAGPGINIKTYEARQRLVRDLRGMASELNVNIWTAMQLNRGTRDLIKEQGFADSENLADSHAQLAPLDLLLSLSATEVEQKAGLGSIFLSKNRSGKGRFLVRVSRDPSTLEYQEVSNEKWRSECSKVSDKAVEDVILEGYANDSTKFFPNGGQQ